MRRRHAVDTHALVWYLEGNPRLGDAARAVLDDEASIPYVPLIALAEACWIVEHGRTRIPSVADLLADVDADPRITVLALDRRALDESLGLTGIPEMHDRLIVATALSLVGAAHGSDGGNGEEDTIAILSRDETITSVSPLEVVW